jgi:hypothetical protein
VPTGAVSIATDFSTDPTHQDFLTTYIGPTSQFVYLSGIVSTGGSDLGQLAYRVPVTDPAAAVPFSGTPVTGREVAIRFASTDESKLLLLSGSNSGDAEIALINSNLPTAEIPLSHTFGPGIFLRRVIANPSLSTVAYLVGDLTHIDLYAARTEPVTTGTLVSPNIPYNFPDVSPEFSAITKDGDEVLISTQVELSGVATQQLLEIALDNGAPAVLQSEPPGFNVYTYVDDSKSIAFTADSGVATLKRGESPSGAVNYYPNQKVAAYEFSPDSQTIAVINTDNTGTSSSHLFLVNRDTRTTPLQITGLTNANSQTTAVRIVPVD